MNILQKHFKKDHVHMRLWTRLYGMFYMIVNAELLLAHVIPQHDGQMLKKIK